MYYELRPDIHADHGILADPIERPGRFRTGRPIDGAFPDPIVFPVDNSDEHPPRGMEGIAVPVWSEPFVRCIRAAGVDNLQLFPAILRNELTGREWRDYLAVNVVGQDPTGLLLIWSAPGVLLAHQRLIDALACARPSAGWGISIRKAKQGGGDGER